MVEVRQYPDLSGPLGSRGRAWIAECTVDGVPYRVRSYTGAPYALARALLAAGVADQPVSVTTAGLPGSCTQRSIAAMAEWTIAEGSTVNVHRARWRPYSAPQNAD